MQVKLEKSFPMNAPGASAWQLLQDIEAVAECMPGAKLTERVDQNNYKGEIRVKLGPAAAAFKGDLEVEEIDPDRRQIRILGKGSDSKGSSAASMVLTARIVDEEDGGSLLLGESQVTLTGKMANFGGRMMAQVSDQIIKQFAANFSNRLVAMGEGEGAEEAGARVAAQPKELNGIALLWSLIVGFFKGLFGGAANKADSKKMP